MSPCSSPASSSVADDERHAAGVRGSRSRRPSRWDRRARAAAPPPTSSSRSSQSMMIPAARAIAGMWIAWLVEPPVASRPTAALTIAFSSTHLRRAGDSRCRRQPISASRCTAARVSAWRSGVPGIDEGGAGHVQPHQLHHHLVANWRCRRRCRCPRRDRLAASASSSSSLPTLPSAIELADALLFLVGEARRHRPAGDQQRRQMAEAQRADQQPGHDLVADAEQRDAVEHAVAERDRGRQRDRVAAEQRQLHARLALGHAVAHRRRRRRRPARSRRPRARRSSSARDSGRRADAPTACRCRR